MSELFEDLYIKYDSTFDDCMFWLDYSDRSEKLFWKDYLDSAFPFENYGVTDFIQSFAHSVDTSEEAIRNLNSYIENERLQDIISKREGRRYRSKEDFIYYIYDDYKDISYDEFKIIVNHINIIDHFKGVRFLYGDEYGNPTDPYWSSGYVLLQRVSGLFLVFFDNIDGCDYFVTNTWKEEKTSFETIYKDLRTYKLPPPIMLKKRPTRHERKKAFKQQVDYFQHNFVVSIAPLVRRHLDEKFWTPQWEEAYQESQKKENPWDGLPLNEDKKYHKEIF